MNRYTAAEILEKLPSFWENPPKDAYWDKPGKYDVKVSEDSITIEVSAMYSSPSLNFPILKRMAEYFDTENINDDDRFGYGGCETCDYGSSYGYTLTVRPNTVE